ncbi:MAG: hypothetical protein WD716_13925 [Fimbriimonadaceae bacterium]
MLLLASTIALLYLNPGQESDAKAYHQRMLEFGKKAKSVVSELEVTINGNRTTFRLSVLRPNFLKMESEGVNYYSDGKVARTEFEGMNCLDFDAPRDHIQAPYLFGLDGVTNAPTILKLVPTATKKTMDDQPAVVLKYRLPDVSGEHGSVTGRVLEITIVESTGRPLSWSTTSDYGSLTGVYRKLETDKDLKAEDFKLKSIVRLNGPVPTRISGSGG